MEMEEAAKTGRLYVKKVQVRDGDSEELKTISVVAWEPVGYPEVEKGEAPTTELQA